MTSSHEEEAQVDDSDEADGDSDSEKSEAASEPENEDDEDQEPKPAARRISDRAFSLKRKRESESDLNKKPVSNSKEAEAYKRVLGEIEQVKDDIRAYEEQINEYEDELRENAAHRTKLLGKDRYFNHYYWFERNGMPFEGDPESSTAAYGYANGRLWVQGPDKLETDGIVDLDPRDGKQYRHRFGMTVSERKNAELGFTQLHASDQYGFYETAEDLDRLIAWLDNRGEREKALRRELNLWRKEIGGSMEKRRQHYEKARGKLAAMEDRVVGIATRKKATTDVNLTKYPCTVWHNSSAMQKYGQLHADGPISKKTKKRTEPKGKESSAAPAGRTTRQGTRYAR